ncbi:tRNase Z endonuclease [Parasponia andersonii]|uniref:ribonuclease Z n=1 Tax=Parasponia andersonii TaxID=3476 RepID=A0A2P5BDP1_PARAD|nr:tRNase Z endonuclease [Parasponia andersonii]
MPNIANLRLLFPLISPLKLKPSLSFSYPPKPKPKSYSYSSFTALASSSSSQRRHRFVPHPPRGPGRRNSSTFRERKSREKGAQMEDEMEKKKNNNNNNNNNVSSVGFNKRRAEGRDKDDKPKKILHLRTRTLNPSNTICYFQILGTGMDTHDTSPSVLLFFDRQRFIFNAGEGLQRYCTEHKIKLSKVDHIFLSRVCSETAGGIPGLLLTLAGMGEGMSVKVWGPSDLKYLVDAMRSFIPNAAMVNTQSFGPSLSSDVTSMPQQGNSTDPIVLVDDEVVKISAILLEPKLSEVKPGDKSVVYVCELPEIKGKFDKEKALAFGVRPGPKYRQLVDGHSVKSDHQDIMVHPSDVLGPSVPGPIVFLVDCPTESHLQQLLSIEYLSSYFADFSGQPESSKVVSCIIHLSPAAVVSSPIYQTWMKRFGSAQHIMAGHERKNMEIPILKSSARIAGRLNYLCPQFFPAPGFWSLKHLGSSASNSIVSSEDSDLMLCESIAAENLLKFTLRPLDKHGLDRSCVPSSMALEEIIDELHSEIPDIVVATQHVSQLWHASIGSTGEISSPRDGKFMVEEPWLNEKTLPSCLENIKRDDMEIILLGTGSSQPSKYRNVSSIHINLFSKGGLLLDCGEGTLGQLKRRYGVDGADNAVRGLRCIWISHIHADHHTGLARILALRRDLLKEEPHEPILVVGPRPLKRYLDAYQRLEDLDMMFLDCWHTTEDSMNAFEGVVESNNNQFSTGEQFSSNNNGNKPTKGQMAQKIDCTLFARGSRMQSYWKRSGSPVDNAAGMKSLKKVLSDAGLEALISFPVVHCPQAFGVVLKAAERTNNVGKVIPGWKIVYSGDTRPCPELAEASHGATVLIHEATFEEGMVDEAVAKNHSTTEEAIEVGNSAGAYRIILTHFSQRYPKIPVFDETHMCNTCIAFDMMSVNVADLPVLPRVLPYLKLLFRNEMVMEESDDVQDALTV